MPKEITQEFERAISLRVIDDAWIDHISDMEHLREGIGLRGYGQTNPLQAYAMEGYELFDRMLDNIDAKIAIYLLNAEITQNTERKQSEEDEKRADDAGLSGNYHRVYDADRCRNDSEKCVEKDCGRLWDHQGKNGKKKRSI